MSSTDYACLRCGVTRDDCPDGIYCWHPSVPESWQSVRYCAACAVLEWPAPIYFVFHQGVPDVVRERLRSFPVLKRLLQWFRHAKPFPVHVYHRREMERLDWQYIYNAARGKSAPDQPYSYRGWCSSDEILLFYDGVETPDSMEWLLYHELGHHVCNTQAHMFDEAMSVENKNEGRTTYDWVDDAGHEADSEERLVNRMATAYLGGREYARPWWRPRVAAHLAGQPLPDPYAAPDALEPDAPGPELEDAVDLPGDPSLDLVGAPALTLTGEDRDATQ